MLCTCVIVFMDISVFPPLFLLNLLLIVSSAIFNFVCMSSFALCVGFLVALRFAFHR